MKTLIKKTLNYLAETYRQLSTELRIKYRVIEFNLKTQEVVLNVKRRSIILKFDFAEAIKEISIIDALSAVDAALLGYFYGRCYRLSQASNEVNKKIKPSPLLLKKERGCFKIVSHNRDGNIGYVDSRTRQVSLENPVAIMRNFHVITNFDPTQACYIGILAGLSFEKVQAIKLKPSLRIID